MTVDTKEDLTALVDLCRDLGVSKLTAFGVSLELGERPRGMTENEVTEWNETVAKIEKGGGGDKEMEFLQLPKLIREPMPPGMTVEMERNQKR